MDPHTEKRPRHYAAEILALRDRAARAAALDAVPAHYRDWVRHLVEDDHAKRRHRAAHRGVKAA